jgi:hypothetical protein
MFDGPKSLIRKFETAQQSVMQPDVFEFPKTNAEYQQLKDDAMTEILKTVPNHMRRMIGSCAW